MSMKKRFWIRKAAGFTLMVIAAVFVFGFVVMSLWNGVLVPVLGISTVSFWQALGILVLSKILFGGFKGGHRGKWGGGPQKHMWGHEMREKWQHMSPEEREQMKQQWRARCSSWGRRDFSGGEKNTGEQAG